MPQNIRTINTATTIPAFDATFSVNVSGEAGQKLVHRISGDTFTDMFGRTRDPRNFLYIPSTGELLHVLAVINEDLIEVDAITAAANVVARRVFADLASFSVTNVGNTAGTLGGQSFPAGASDNYDRVDNAMVQHADVLFPMTVDGSGTTIRVVEQK